MFIYTITLPQLSLYDPYCKTSMALTAENLAVKYEISRDAVDAYALRSQQNFRKANETGIFKTEITAVPLTLKGNELSFEVDEHPK